MVTHSAANVQDLKVPEETMEAIEPIRKPPARHRIQREAGAIQVGCGANAVVGEPQPAIEGPPRATRRHPSSVSRSRMCSHPLALHRAVMLGVVSRPNFLLTADHTANYGWRRERTCKVGRECIISAAVVG